MELSPASAFIFPGGLPASSAAPQPPGAGGGRVAATAGRPSSFRAQAAAAGRRRGGRSAGLQGGSSLPAAGETLRTERGRGGGRWLAASGSARGLLRGRGRVGGAPSRWAGGGGRRGGRPPPPSSASSSSSPQPPASPEAGVEAPARQTRSNRHPGSEPLCARRPPSRHPLQCTSRRQRGTQRHKD
ncbi:uncharacterized protein [Lepidochelys kempii]|uniref:uncharacterized protein isoform X2 n=1 Tax=Lepidochelys kempii TaxID=8472 RepID=UPI003C70129F